MWRVGGEDVDEELKSRFGHSNILLSAALFLTVLAALAVLALHGCFWFWYFAPLSLALQLSLESFSTSCQSLTPTVPVLYPSVVPVWCPCFAPDVYGAAGAAKDDVDEGTSYE
jgi:hypothetical protein